LRVVRIIIPPDKSISQRAIMLASISEGATHIKNLLMGDDVLHMLRAFSAMGVQIDYPNNLDIKEGCNKLYTSSSSIDIYVHGVGMKGLKRPSRDIFLGNSGTGMRLLSGLLSGQNFEVRLTGDESLSKRPMRRIVEPLRKMGAEIFGSRSPGVSRRDARLGKVQTLGQEEIYPPLQIHGGRLKAISYRLPIPSAQVKSAILLAGLYTEGLTSVIEPIKTRDHTERMLKLFGCNIKVQGRRVTLKGPAKLKSPGIVEIPGDISSAAFFLVAGLVLPDTKIIVEDVGLNPTRIGILDILKKMHAKITILTRPGVSMFEPVGDIIAYPSRLRGIRISPEDVARSIDEIPILMVAACFAEGQTTIEGIEELHVKETDRIKSMVTNLSKIGADIRLEARGSRLKRERVVINGGRPLHGGRVSSFGDHRTAMSMLVARRLAGVDLEVTGLDCIKKSFPGFERVFASV